MSGALVRRTSTGSLVSRPGYLQGYGLTGGSDAATATLRRGGASGTIVAVLAAAAGETTPWWPGHGQHDEDWHVTLTGTSPSFTAVL